MNKLFFQLIFLISTAATFQEDTFRLMTEQIVPLLDHSEAEILLLVCNSVSNTTVREKGNYY
jgi:hypothetical protein